MPSPMPIATITPVNRLFGSIRINTTNDGFVTNRLASTYYMNTAGEFVRLRPQHRDGFAVLRKPARVVGIYTGNWDRTQDFNWNATNNNNIVYRPLGNSHAAITQAIGNLENTTQTTAQILNHNGNPVNNLHDSVVYVNDGALKGCFFGGDQNITNNRYMPMGVVDATNDNATNVHKGDTLITAATAQEFYDLYFPGVLTQLMQLGQSAQSVQIDLSPKGRAQPVEIMTNLQFFASDMFEDDADQLKLLRAMVMSFV